MLCIIIALLTTRSDGQDSTTSLNFDITKRSETTTITRPEASKIESKTNSEVWVIGGLEHPAQKFKINTPIFFCKYWTMAFVWYGFIALIPTVSDINTTLNLICYGTVWSRVIFLITNTSLPKAGKRRLIGPYSLRREVALHFTFVAHERVTKP